MRTAISARTCLSAAGRIGNNAKIQNNVSLYDGCVPEDDVFCGPSVVFTNVNNPRSENDAAAERLLSESVRGRIVIVGDVMREVLATFKPQALASSAYPGQAGVGLHSCAVLTVHRPVNSDRTALAAIVDWCRRAPFPVLFPAHPRNQHDIADILADSPASDRLHVSPPLSYLDMLATVAQARLVLTDSGGLQKEAFFLGVTCVTLRGETEWQETVAAGWNVLTFRPDPAAPVHQYLPRALARLLCRRTI